MRLSLRIVCAAVAASLVVAVPATARNFSIDDQNFRVRGPRVKLKAVAATVECPVTLAGSFHGSTISKRLGLLFGVVNRATLDSAQCTGGSATVLTGTLPWGLAYMSFGGRLPAIQRKRTAVYAAAFQSNVGGATCLFRTDAAEPLVWEFNIGAEGAMRTLDFDVSAEIDLEDEDFLCAIAGDAAVEGTADVDDGGGGTLFVRLIQ
jgi:hypothetical protein